MTAPSEDEVTSEMTADGFLSPLLDQYRERVIAAHSQSFDLARRINRLAVSTWLNHSIEASNQSPNDLEPLAVRLFARAMNAFEASVILLERGMTVEAGTMIRSVYETGFWLNYLHKAPKAAIKNFLLDDLRGKEGRFKAFEKLYQGDQDLLPKIKAELVKVRGELRDQGRALTIEQIAVGGGVGNYFAYYKLLCGSSAHASVLSTDHYLQFFENNEAGHTIGPDLEGSGRKLGFACHSIILALHGFAQVTANIDASYNLLKLTQEFFDLSKASNFGVPDSSEFAKR